MQRYSRADPYFRGKWSSPTDSRFLRVSTITSLYKVLWAGSIQAHFLGVKSMNTSLKVNCAWNENTFHQRALRRVLIFTEKEKWDRYGQFSSSNILIHPCKSIWSKLLLSNLISCFFIRWWYPPINMNSSWVWTRQEKYTNSNQQWVVDAEVLCSTHWVTFTIYMSYSKTAVFREDKVHSGFKKTQIVMRLSSSHWWEVSQHFIHTKHYSKDFTHMNLSSTKQQQ